MVADTGPLGRSRGLVGLVSLPAFELPAIGGGTVQSWGYRSREHLVLALLGNGVEAAVVKELARREREVRAEDAAVLIVFQREAEAVWERAGKPGRAAVDAEGRVHARLGAESALAAAEELLVVDRDGTIYWRAATSEAPAERLVDEAISWLQYMNILEHECGTCVPAWPDEDLP